ncbi:MAG: carboxypeptidase [Thermoleophilia bacterium]|nr:carboxypeptidase [Thermoleophilia bacterium]
MQVSAPTSAGTPYRIDQPQRPAYLDDAATIDAGMHRLAAEHPGLARTVDVATSVQGRPVTALVLGTHADDPSVPRVLLTAGVHGREIANPAALMAWAQRTLTAAAGGDPARQALLDARTVLLVPLVNPDAHDVVVHGLTVGDGKETWQRTNLRPGGGVDLNRNFEGAWGAGSATPGSDNYRGPAPASEPEVRGVELLGSTWRPAGVYDIHSQGGVVLAPDGTDAARAAADLVSRATGYGTSTSGEHWATEVGGTIKDWAHERLGAASLTIETGAVAHQDATQFAETLTRLLPALDALVATVDGRHPAPAAAAALASPAAAPTFIPSEHLGDAKFGTRPAER